MVIGVRRPYTVKMASRSLAPAATLLALGAMTALAQAAPASSARHAPVIPYANVWADATGRTHISACSVPRLKLVTYAPPAAPEWIGVPPGEIGGIAYEVSPRGYVGTWHRAPGPQWVVTLSGRWAVETTDGHQLIQGPGDVQFNADSSSYAHGSDGRVGHTSRTVGDAPSVRLIIQLRKKRNDAHADRRCPF
jgi:hypothetical protein